jgi:Caspase domain
VGVFVGVSKFKSAQIKPLKCSDKDAEQMAQVMQETCKLDKAVVLTTEQATQANIRRVICEELPAVTRPGDTVVLYWSGHGGRCPSKVGGEYQEYLAPYDGDLRDLNAIQRSMVMDTAFARWVRDLDGRKVIVILDTCHSGGIIKGAVKRVADADDYAKYAKGVGDFVEGKFKTHFLDNQMSQMKALGQHDTAVLASSTAKQVSFERREKDLSVMTFFIINLLKEEKGQRTLEEVYKDVEGKVKDYVEDKFPGMTQTPVLVDDLTKPPPLYVKP